MATLQRTLRYNTVPFLALLLLFVPATGTSPAAHAEPTATPQRYEIRLTPDLAHMDVRTCFASVPPTLLQANGPRARTALSWIQHRGTGAQHALKARGDSIRLAGIKRGDCLSYRVDLKALASWHRSQGRGVANGVILTDPDDWLWLPPNARAAIELRFKLPPGMALSVPWQAVPAAGAHVYRLSTRNPNWDAQVAFGQLDRFDIPMAGTTLRVAVLAGTPAVDLAAMRDWITSGARAMSTLHMDTGALPPVQLLIVPVGHADEPVPWAEVQRGGGEAVHLYVDQHRSREAFINDWTLVHELGHLLHPRLPQTDAWLYEGLASYYQNVLRARAGLLTPLTAWRKLHAGFQRGIREIPDRQQLARVANDMHRNHRYMQIYWSGAAYALEVDIRLRQQSGGNRSLDSVLARFLACCLPAEKRWSGEVFVRRLDALSGTNLFYDTYQRYRQLRTFPALQGVYRELGLVAAGDDLRLDDRAPLARLRRTIMSDRIMAGD